MGWGKDTRRSVYELQDGLCQFCGNPMTFCEMVLHHHKNRCQNGPSTVENARGRHSHCEVEAHKLYRYGNPDVSAVQPCKAPKPAMKKKRRLRSDKRPLQPYRAMLDEQYAFRMWCEGRL